MADDLHTWLVAALTAEREALAKWHDELLQQVHAHVKDAQVQIGYNGTYETSFASAGYSSDIGPSFPSYSPTVASNESALQLQPPRGDTAPPPDKVSPREDNFTILKDKTLVVAPAADVRAIPSASRNDEAIQLLYQLRDELAVLRIEVNTVPTDRMTPVSDVGTATQTDRVIKMSKPIPLVDHGKQVDETGARSDATDTISSGMQTTSTYRRTRTAAEIEEAEEKQVEHHITRKGVKESIIKKMLRKEADEQAACFSLPEILFFFFVTVITVTSHANFEQLYAADVAISFDVEENANFAFSGVVPFESGRMGHKGIYDVNSIPDFWSWFGMGLVALWVPSETDWGISEVPSNVAAMCTAPFDSLQYWGWSADELTNTSKNISNTAKEMCPSVFPSITLDAELKSMHLFEQEGDKAHAPTYLYFQTIIGGIRLRQERLSTAECPLNKHLEGHIHFGACSETSPGYYLMPEKHHAMEMHEELTNRPGGRDVYLLSKTPQDEVLKKLRTLETEGWVSPLTAKIEVMFVTYNAHQGLLTANFILFFLNRNGHIYKIVEPVSLWMDPYHDNPLLYVLDFIWLLLIFKIFVEESSDIFRHCRQIGVFRGPIKYAGVYNMVDWANITISVVIVWMWFGHLSRINDLDELLQKADVSLQGSFSEQSEIEEFFRKVHEAVSAAGTFRTIIAMYQFLIAGRFFKAFDAQPRLAMVTRTISSAIVHIIHFGVVFFTIFFLFVTAAHLLFGQELKYFSNYPRSCHTTFRILLGDFDWEEMTEIGRPQAILWFWLMQIGLNMIMLNMLLGIILDTYSSVKDEIMSQPGVETLWSQAYEIWDRKKKVWSGKRMPLASILKILDPNEIDDTDDGEDVTHTLDGFLEKMEGQLSHLEEGKEQAKDILVQAYRYYGDGETTVMESEWEAVARHLQEHLMRVERKVDYLHRSHHISQPLQHHPRLWSAEDKGKLAKGQMEQV